MSTNKEQTLRQFCDVTGADESRSKFFLDSSNWQLDVALSSFYEHGGNLDEAPPANPAAAVSSLPTFSDSDMESPPQSPLPAVKKDKKKAPPGKFATLDSLQQESSSEEEEESAVDRELKEEIEELKIEIERLTLENSKLRKDIMELGGTVWNGASLDANQSQIDSGQAFYAGGSERSGQQIIEPGKGRKDIVSEVFKSVRERGAVFFEDEPSSTSRGRSVFGGVGYRLGQTADDHETVNDAERQGRGAGAPRIARVRLYREGFTVDSGPLRFYTDPEHAEFINCIRRGIIPTELRSEGTGEVQVSLEDRRHEECPRNVPKAQAFAGKGHLLGSPTPVTVGATAAVASAPSDRAANLRAAQDNVNLDEAQPVTTIQFRLADGSRLTGRFNHTHTVADLHEYVSRAEPSYQLQSFVLLTTFPSTELTDTTVTLAQAKLLNTTLLQRLKDLAVQQ